MIHAAAAKPKPDLTTGPFLPKIIRYAVPIMLTSLLQLLFNAADLVVVGQVCGPECVGAVGATSTLVSILVTFFIRLSTGAGVLIAQRIGARDENGVHRALHTAIPTALISGAILTAVGVFFTETFLGWMGTPAELLPLSALYLRIYFAGITATLLYNYGAAILRAAGETKAPLFILFAAGVLNLGLNLLFVLAFGMTVGGVALATTISQVFSAAGVTVVLMRRSDACRLQWKKIRIYGESLKQILRIGLPVGLSSALFHIANVIIQSGVNSFGSAAVQGNAAAASAGNFVNATMACFELAALNIVGQNYGAKKFDNVKKTIGVSLGCAAAGLFFGIGLYLLGRPVLSLYLSADAPAAAFDAGMTRFFWVVMPYAMIGVMGVFANSLRGIGYSLMPTLVNVVGSCGVRLFFVLFLFRFESLHSLDVLYASYPVSWTLTAAAHAVCLAAVWKRTKRKAGVA